MISYDGLYDQLQKKEIRKTGLTMEIGISSRTIAKIAKGAGPVPGTIKFLILKIC